MEKTLPHVAGNYRIFCGNRLILSRCDFRPSFWFRARGLLGRGAVEDGEGILISPCNSVHMLFMSFPIDVLFLDPGCRVLRLCAELRPWRFSPIVWKASAVLEIGAGATKAKNIQAGDRLRFQLIE